MKAVRIAETGGQEVLEYVDIEEPEPGPDEILVRVESIGVNYADTMIRKGIYPVMPELPAILGMEATGVVEKAGTEVSTVGADQRVAFIGFPCYAEKAVIPAAAAIPLPPEIDFDTGASFLVTYLTAHHLLDTMGRVKRGGVVLLYAAAGGVGTATIQLAKIAEIEIIGLTSSDEKVKRLQRMGLEHVFTYDQPDLVDEVRRVTGGRGVDAILDSVAGPQFYRNFEMLAPLGQLVWFGYSGGMPPEDLLQHLGAHFIKGIGLQTFHLTYSIAEPYPELAAQSVGMLMEHLVAGRIEPIIHDRFPLTEANRAHELLENRSTVGKLLLKP